MSHTLICSVIYKVTAPQVQSKGFEILKASCICTSFWLYCAFSVLVEVIIQYSRLTVNGIGVFYYDSFFLQISCFFVVCYICEF